MSCATEIASIQACMHAFGMHALLYGCFIFFPLPFLARSLYLFMREFHFCMQMSREAVHAHRKFSLISLRPADLPKEEVAAVRAPVIKWFVGRGLTAAFSWSRCKPRPHTPTPATTLISIISPHTMWEFKLCFYGNRYQNEI